MERSITVTDNVSGGVDKMARLTTIFAELPPALVQLPNTVQDGDTFEINDIYIAVRGVNAAFRPKNWLTSLLWKWIDIDMKLEINHIAHDVPKNNPKKRKQK